jgi:hypothetical protein
MNEVGKNGLSKKRNAGYREETVFLTQNSSLGI